MATYTPNLNLKKPSTDDVANIDDINNNMDVVDSVINIHVSSISNPHSVNKEQIGLGNVPNESKETLFSNPIFTGVPIAPTADAGTNTTQIATTAFIYNALSSFSSSPFEAGTTEPTNTNLLWVDTNISGAPILKYHNGTTWVSISGTWGGV